MYLISLYFDEKTNKRIQQYIDQIAKKTGNRFMSDVPPHITISAFETNDDNNALQVFYSAASTLKSGSLNWVSAGQFFPNVIFITPFLNEYLHLMSEIIYTTIMQNDKIIGVVTHVIVDNPYTGNLKVDEVEYTEAYENAIDAVEEEVARRMGNQPYAMGMCFEIWSIKKEILLEKYKIEWRTPSQMNPRVMFD